MSSPRDFPTLSVITPVYNGQRFIESCIASVVRQGYPQVEHVIIDGGSTDDTVPILRRQAEHYPHIRWVSERDRGQSDAMNRGLALARGAVIGFLNADDYYEPGTLNRVSAVFRSLPEPSLLVGNCNVVDEEGARQWLNRPATEFHRLLQPWRHPMPMNPSAYFYHRSLHDLIGAYDVEDHYAMDYDFLLRAVRAAKVAYLDETFGNFRWYAGTKTYDDVRSGEHKGRVYGIARRHAALKGFPYPLGVTLSIWLDRNAHKWNWESPPVAFKAKWRLASLGLRQFDRIIHS